MPLSVLACAQTVKQALSEDLGHPPNDITSQLIPKNKLATAQIICKEDSPVVVCGIDWVNEVFKQVDPELQVMWLVRDGQVLTERACKVLTVTGSARGILTAERTALNFLQTLSGTATIAYQYVSILRGAGLSTKLLDTRKTIPGLRQAQKYAAACGGCKNHRMGLYDAFLIKENHILACGSIKEAVKCARLVDPSKPVEVEVENLDEHSQALHAGADIIMLDDFSLENMRKAVQFSKGLVKLEASGNITQDNLLAVAETGVDFISIGALTKHCRAIDFSMRMVNE